MAALRQQPGSPLQSASAEIAFMGSGSDATGLEASSKRVRYLRAAVVGGSGSSTGSGNARIGLDNLLVGGEGIDEVNDVSIAWDAKEEIYRDSTFGYDTAFAADDDGYTSNYPDPWTHARDQGTVLDVAIFRVPAACAYGPRGNEGRDGDGCDWPSLAGVGATVTERRPQGFDSSVTTTTTYYCCHWRAIKAGACSNTSETRDRLILNGNFTGFHRTVHIPPSSGEWAGLNVSNGTIRVAETGTWVVAFASCNGGRGLHSALLRGEVVFESDYGYLPAELLPYTVLAVVLAAISGALFAWFLARMRRYASSRVSVEKWILLTIALAGIEASLQVAGCAVWNQTGYQSYTLAVAVVVAGALKSGVGRCVLLTAALGWGVTKESLQCLTAAGVVLLGAATVPLEVLVDLDLIHEVRDTRAQTFLGAMRVAADAFPDLSGVETAAYLIFAVWTAAALGWTIWTLWKARQTRKLGRYLRLAAVLLVSALCAAIVGAVAQARIRRDVRYVLLQENAERAIFVAALAGVAVLWRPNESAREYAYAAQLPTSPPEEEGGYDEGVDGLVLEHEADADYPANVPGTNDGTHSDDDGRAAVDAHGEIELPRVA
jgi:Lung seven transmembrane receptor